jgi:hypothetical protein
MVMPFGMSNAHVTFPELINKIFLKYLRKFVLVFFNYTLAYGKSMAQHQIHLKIA